MKFTLEADHKTVLEKLANSGMTPAVTARRAKILLLKELGKSSSDIADELGISRHTAELWVNLTKKGTCFLLRAGRLPILSYDKKRLLKAPTIVMNI